MVNGKLLAVVLVGALDHVLVVAPDCEADQEEADYYGGYYAEDQFPGYYPERERSICRFIIAFPVSDTQCSSIFAE